MASHSRFDREILRLALPALGALAADPLVSLVDTAFVGRLGTSALGALAVAAAVFGVAFALFNFLAYGTTPLVARAVGRGDFPEAGRVAVTAVVLGLGLGVAAAAVLVPAARSVLGVMGASADTVDVATGYLRIRAMALPAVLVVTAGHGIFRGFQDTVSPLMVNLGLNLVNLVLDPILIFGFDRGLAGAAWATVAAQWCGALWFLRLMWMRREAMGLTAARARRQDFAVILVAGRALVLRTGSLLGILTVATAVAARVGTAQVAAHQVLFQIWIFLSLVVDALAVAAQAMIGKTLVADPGEAAAIARRLLVFGAWIGCGLAVVLAAVGHWLPGWFSSAPDVVAALRGVYPFLVVMQPLNALVFVWDGIVIGAADFGFLSWSMVVAALVAGAAMAPVLPMNWGLAGVWWAIVALMLGRAATLVRWQMRGPLSGAPGPSRGSPAA